MHDRSRAGPLSEALGEEEEQPVWQPFQLLSVTRQSCHRGMLRKPSVVRDQVVELAQSQLLH